MREILSGEIFQIALAVLEVESPLKKNLPGEANRILGRIEGYDESLTKLKTLGEYSSRVNIDNDEVIEGEKNG
jgi:hypothetical protein